MPYLIRNLIHVKDGLTLFAFVCLVLLVAFKTKGVPELIFKLMKEVLKSERGKDQFSLLLHRFLQYGFLGFVFVCGVATVSQVLAHQTQSRPFSVDEAEKEVGRSEAPAQQKQDAVKAYSEGVALATKGDLDQAVQSIQASVEKVPTLAAQYTLAYLFYQKSDLGAAWKYATEALSSAKGQGDSMAVLRTEELWNTIGRAKGISDKDPAPPVINPDGTCRMIGNKAAFPKGGTSFETAVKVSPGLYLWTESLANAAYRYYKINVKQGQTLTIALRCNEQGGYAGAAIHDGNGVNKTGEARASGRSASTSVHWTADASAEIWFTIGSEGGNAADTVYCVEVQ